MKNSAEGAASTSGGADERIFAPTVDAFGGRESGPLTGIVVADFSRVLAGPYCTMLLGDMGATVIKVEGPQGDETRTWTPPVHDDTSTYYLSINRNKRSIALDLNDEHDLGIAHVLAARADVVVENFKPGGLNSFELDYGCVRRVNPNVIYASITGFGTANGAALPGYDLLAQALSGLMSLTGEPDGVTLRSGVAVFDVITGLHAAVGVLAALHERQRTGRGQHVELNLLSSALSGMVNQSAGYILSGNVPIRMGNEHPSIYPYEPFPTSDGEIVITVGNDRQFRSLCQGLDRPAIAMDERFAAAPARSANRSDLRPLLRKRLVERTTKEWFQELTLVGVPCAPINDVRGGLEFAAEIGLDPVVHAGRGEDALPGIRNPISFSETPVSYPLAPPRLDEQRDQILAWLRAPAWDDQRLRADGIGRADTSRPRRIHS